MLTDDLTKKFEKYFNSDLEDLIFNEHADGVSWESLKYDEGRLQGMLDAMFLMGIITEEFFSKKSNEIPNSNAIEEKRLRRLWTD